MSVPNERLRAAERVDWMQVLLNLLNGQESGRDGQPCFHVEDDRFCLRAKFWAGHGDQHDFVSLAAALASQEQAAEQSDYVCTHCMREVPENAPCPWCGVGFPSEPTAPATRETVLEEAAKVAETTTIRAIGEGAIRIRIASAIRALAADESTPTVGPRETRDAKL